MKSAVTPWFSWSLQASDPNKPFGDREPRRILGDISNTAHQGRGLGGKADDVKRQVEPCTPATRKTRSFTVFEDDGHSHFEATSAARPWASPPYLQNPKIRPSPASLGLHAHIGAGRDMILEDADDLPDVDSFMEPPGSARDSFWRSVLDDAPEGAVDACTFAEALARGTEIHALEAERQDALAYRWSTVILPGEDVLLSSPENGLRAWPTLTTPDQDRNESSPRCSPFSMRSAFWPAMEVDESGQTDVRSINSPVRQRLQLH